MRLYESVTISLMRLSGTSALVAPGGGRKKGSPRSSGGGASNIDKEPSERVKQTVGIIAGFFHPRPGVPRVGEVSPGSTG